jgi:hypothetical protein
MQPSEPGFLQVSSTDRRELLYLEGQDDSVVRVTRGTQHSTIKFQKLNSNNGKVNAELKLLIISKMDCVTHN